MTNPRFSLIIHKLLVLATEIRCQEKTRGGVCYEVILADPVTSPKQRVLPVAKNETSFEEIEQKLRAAEERRIVSRLFKKITYVILILYQIRFYTFF